MNKYRGTLCAFLFFLSIHLGAWAQVRPDAFDPIDEPVSKASITMANTLDEMREWDKYPTYPVYVEMMQWFASNYSEICQLDTIGTSVRGRLILALHIVGTAEGDKPEFFYSSTIHGDELTGFYLMLRLCDTLLSSYGTDSNITQLLNTTHVYINPLANPDGTYRNGNESVAYAMRYNANMVDLNRNYPDPFGTEALSPLQPENAAMIAYVSRHHFLMAANIHGGSEVMNYPWDSFTSNEVEHPDKDWWIEVSKRFVDSCRVVEPSMFRSVNNNGVIAGGDWYVIHNGRQDYMNQHFSIRELTIEISTIKKLPTNQLDTYWRASAQSWINYIKEVQHVPTASLKIQTTEVNSIEVYPNPTTGPVTIKNGSNTTYLDLSTRPAGMYIFNISGSPVKIIKL